MSVMFTAMVIVPCAAFVQFDIINPRTISPKIPIIRVRASVFQC